MPVVTMVGGGQLARMTHQAAIALGQSLRVLSGGPDEPAAQVCRDVVIGSHTDLDALRTSLANLFEGIDDYTDLIDPVTSVELARGAISDDLTDIVQALEHGLVHYRAGRTVEALWWWQFSYLSEWGVRAAASLRALLTILRHLRLDVDDEAAAEAEFDALHP